MPPWKWVLNDEEIYQVIFYEQSFSTAEDYNAKWAPQYTDSFGRNLMGGPTASSMFSGSAAAVATSVLAGILLWDLQRRNLLKFLELIELKKLMRISIGFWRNSYWI